VGCVPISGTAELSTSSLRFMLNTKFNVNVLFVQRNGCLALFLSVRASLLPVWRMQAEVKSSPD
jgi:hypothetical protein